MEICSKLAFTFFAFNLKKNIMLLHMVHNVVCIENDFVTLVAFTFFTLNIFFKLYVITYGSYFNVVCIENNFVTLIALIDLLKF